MDTVHIRSTENTPMDNDQTLVKGRSTMIDQAQIDSLPVEVPKTTPSALDLHTQELFVQLKEFMNQQIHTMQTGLISTLSDMRTKMEKKYTERDTAVTSLTDSLTSKDRECAEFMKTIHDLRAENAKLTTQLSESKWKAFRNSGESKTLLLGSSIIRDIDHQKLKQTDVRSISGAKVSNLLSEVEKLQTNHYDKIVVVGGGNDCADSSDTITTVNKFKELIVAAKKANSVTIASICSRQAPDNQGVQDVIDTVNAGVQGICADMECTYCDTNTGVQGLCADMACTYCDTNDILQLSDGSINQGYYLDHSIHLTYKGQNKIAQKLELQAVQKDAPHSVTRAQKAQQKSQRSSRGQTASQRSNVRATVYTHSDNRNSEHAKRPTARDISSTHRRASGCDYCAEPNHATERCYHQAPVKCNTCGYSGHTSKYCESNNMGSNDNICY